MKQVIVTVRINRYIMECKCLHDAQIYIRIYELIDTLWNVNYFKKTVEAGIDERINRYIMECKCHCITRSGIRFCELIDTLWNVNYNHGTQQLLLCSN